MNAVMTTQLHFPPITDCQADQHATGVCAGHSVSDQGQRGVPVSSQDTYVGKSKKIAILGHFLATVKLAEGMEAKLSCDYLY